MPTHLADKVRDGGKGVHNHLPTSRLALQPNEVTRRRAPCQARPPHLHVLGTAGEELGPARLLDDAVLLGLQLRRPSPSPDLS